MASLTVQLSMTLPVLGLRTYSFLVPDDAALDAVELLGGGAIAGTASVTRSSDGIALAASFDLPLLGAKTLQEDLKLAGLEQAAIDALLALDGGSLTANLTVKS